MFAVEMWFGAEDCVECRRSTGLCPLPLGLPLCPKDKNRSPFHGEKPLKIVICFYEAMSKRQTKGTVLLVC